MALCESLAQKVKNVVFKSKISAMPLTSRDRTTDIAYCANVTFLYSARCQADYPFCAFFLTNDLFIYLV